MCGGVLLHSCLLVSSFSCYLDVSLIVCYSPVSSFCRYEADIWCTAIGGVVVSYRALVVGVVVYSISLWWFWCILLYLCIVL